MEGIQRQDSLNMSRKFIPSMSKKPVGLQAYLDLKELLF